MANILNSLKGYIFSAIAGILFFFIEGYYFEFSQLWEMVRAQDRGAVNYLLWIVFFLLGLVINIQWIYWSYQSKPVFRFIYAGMFLIGVLIQHGYWQALHRFIQPSDVGLIGITSPKDWVSSYKLFFNWSGIFFCIPYLTLLYLTRTRQKTRGIHLLALIAGILGLSLITAAFEGRLILGSSYSEFFHTIILYAVNNSEPPVRNTLSYKASDKPDQNIVLIIDEGIRADHLSINGYSRDTTPWLVELNKTGHMINWGIASSGATCSQISNHLLITGVAPGPQQQADPNLLPTIFQYAESLNYQLFYFDAQTNYLWNGLSSTDIDTIEWINTDILGREPIADLIAAERIRDILKQSTGNFIVLNKRGVHFMYEDSYPSDNTIWKPLPPNQDYTNYPDLVINPYDNGIRYSVNEFFRVLIHETDSFKNTWYIYTSDHAQTLFEDGMTWSHCNDSMQEASVPLLLIGKMDKVPETTYPASHSNILPTILDLMNYPESEIHITYNHSLLDENFSTQKRYFIDGASRIIEFSP